MENSMKNNIVKMKKIIVILLAISSLFGCGDSLNDNAISMNTANRSDAELRQLIIQKGDSSAYYELSTQYLDYGYQDFLFYALIMANKYNYPDAYMDVFDCLTTEYIDSIEMMDEETAKMAVDYLFKAYDNNQNQAIEFVNDYHIKKRQTDNVSQLKRIYGK